MSAPESVGEARRGWVERVSLEMTLRSEFLPATRPIDSEAVGEKRELVGEDDSGESGLILAGAAPWLWSSPRGIVLGWRERTLEKGAGDVKQEEKRTRPPELQVPYAGTLLVHLVLTLGPLY